LVDYAARGCRLERDRQHRDRAGFTFRLPYCHHIQLPD